MKKCVGPCCVHVRRHFSLSRSRRARQQSKVRPSCLLTNDRNNSRMQMRYSGVGLNDFSALETSSSLHRIAQRFDSLRLIYVLIQFHPLEIDVGQYQQQLLMYSFFEDRKTKLDVSFKRVFFSLVLSLLAVEDLPRCIPMREHRVSVFPAACHAQCVLPRREKKKRQTPRRCAFYLQISQRNPYIIYMIIASDNDQRKSCHQTSIAGK